MDALSYLEMYQNITTETLFTKSLFTWADKIIVSRSETSPLRSIPQQQSATTTGKSLKNRGFFLKYVPKTRDFYSRKQFLSSQSRNARSIRKISLEKVGIANRRTSERT